ncbi:MAG TPA: GNAT family N-acyltransferase [Usitatibacter sp.]|nr:GNAT family N-acyltransferase [Usitatibacter sp.]
MEGIGATSGAANPARGAANAPRFRASASREHLLVRDLRAERVVCACSLLPPAIVETAGGYDAERIFDLAMLDVLRSRMVELGGPRIDRGYRTGAILQHLGSSLARYLVEHGYDYVMASVEIPLADGGHAAASAYRCVSEAHISPEDLRAIPRQRLPLEALRSFLPHDPPALLRAWLDLGAWVCGEPAIDPAFDRAAIPLLLPLARMRGRYAREFLARAA